MMDKDIANFIYENTTKSILDLDLQGIWICDREPSFVVCLSTLLILGLNTAVIGWDVVQRQIPAVSFVHRYDHVFAFKSVILIMYLPVQSRLSLVQSNVPQASRLCRSSVSLFGVR